MIITDTAKKYAKALFDLADTDEKKREQLKNLSLVMQVLDKPNFHIFFSSPQITEAQKKQVLQKAVPEKQNKELSSFLNLLLDNKRLSYLPQILEFYKQMVDRLTGTKQITLITDTPIDEKTIRTLQETLAKKLQRNIVLKNEINSDLIGGGILIIENKMLDFSIRGKLNQLKEDLISINV